MPTAVEALRALREQIQPPHGIIRDAALWALCRYRHNAHWSGAKHRLNRLKADARFGSPEYAKEEIRADLSSLFLSAELGIPYDPKDQAAYIGNWIQVLKNDKNEVFRAAADASKACDYLHSLENGKVKDNEPGPYAEHITAETAQRRAHYR